MAAAAEVTNGDAKAVDKTEAEPAKKEQKIISQVEYYFGDINLPRDKFLQEEMKKDNGWIPLSTMLKFNRLATITTDIDTISAALRQSHLVDISEDDQKVRRNPDIPLPENTLEYWQEIKRRTVYLKGFPQDATLDEISDFVGQFGTVQNVLMRKTRGGKEAPRIFKGSVFATYVNQEQAKQTAAQKELKFRGEHPLINMMQDDYWASKHAERQKKKELKKQMKKTQIEQQNKAHYLKGMVLKLVGLKPPQQEGTTTTMAEGGGENGVADKVVKKEEPKEPKQEPELIEELKAYFEPFSKAAYVLVDANGNEATLRFTGEENAAKTALQTAIETSKADGKIKVNEMLLTGSVLEGDDEANYWADFNKAKVAKSKRTAAHHGGGNKKHQKGGKGEADDRGNKKYGKKTVKRKADKGIGHQMDKPKGKRTVFNDNDGEEEMSTEGNAAAKEEAVEAKKPKMEEEASQA